MPSNPCSPPKTISAETSRYGVAFTVREGSLMILICPDCCTTKSRVVSPGGAVTKSGAVNPPATRCASSCGCAACAWKEAQIAVRSAAEKTVKADENAVFEREGAMENSKVQPNSKKKLKSKLRPKP